MCSKKDADDWTCFFLWDWRKRSHFLYALVKLWNRVNRLGVHESWRMIAALWSEPRSVRCSQYIYLWLSLCFATPPLLCVLLYKCDSDISLVTTRLHTHTHARTSSPQSTVRIISKNQTHSESNLYLSTTDSIMNIPTGWGNTLVVAHWKPRKQKIYCIYRCMLFTLCVCVCVYFESTGDLYVHISWCVYEAKIAAKGTVRSHQPSAGQNVPTLSPEKESDATVLMEAIDKCWSERSQMLILTFQSPHSASLFLEADRASPHGRSTLNCVSVGAVWTSHQNRKCML